MTCLERGVLADLSCGASLRSDESDFLVINLLIFICYPASCSSSEESYSVIRPSVLAGVGGSSAKLMTFFLDLEELELLDSACDNIFIGLSKSLLS